MYFCALISDFLPRFNCFLFPHTFLCITDTRYLNPSNPGFCPHSFENGRITRVALPSLIAGVVCVKVGRCGVMRDVTVSWPLWLVAVSLLVVHTSLTFLLNVPGCPRSVTL